MSVARIALSVVTAGLFITAVSLSMAAVILTLLGMAALLGTFAVGHTRRSAPVPRPPVRLPITVAHVDLDEPRDAIPPGYPGYRGSIRYVRTQSID